VQNTCFVVVTIPSDLDEFRVAESGFLFYFRRLKGGNTPRQKPLWARVFAWEGLDSILTINFSSSNIWALKGVFAISFAHEKKGDPVWVWVDDAFGLVFVVGGAERVGSAERRSLGLFSV
jgi:hypothetical protein